VLARRRRLRVADASIMPDDACGKHQTRGDHDGEKAADMIRQDN